MLQTGDQVIADGRVEDSEGLEIDESLLTGESDPVAKTLGDDVRSGSIVVAGHGRFQATAVGAQAYATQLAAEAKQTRTAHSELVAGTTRLLRWISLVMLVVAPFLLWSQFNTSDNKSWQAAVTGAVAALVGMVPEGLVLLTSLAFTVGDGLARAQADAGSAAAGGRGPGPRRRRLPRQDRHAHPRRHRLRPAAAARGGRRRGRPAGARAVGARAGHQRHVPGTRG